MQLALLAAVAALLASSSHAGDELRGTFRLRAGDVTLTLVLERPSAAAVRGTLSSSNGTELSLEGTVEDGVARGTCTGADGRSLFEAELDGGTLVLTLVELDSGGAARARSLELARAPGAPPPARAPRAAAAVPPPPAARGPAGGESQAGGDASLLRFFAGTYYSYTGGSTLSGGSGTERRIVLCPDGHYRDSYEHGGYGGGWGIASQRGGGGRWSMSGDASGGVLLLVSPDGQARRVRYEANRAQQTLRLDGTLFAFEGPARCP